MCKRKKSTKRRGRKEERSETSNPVVIRTNDIAPMPQSHMEPAKDGKPRASLAPDEAMVMPTEGKAALKRIFLGLGWAGEAGVRVDVDCCAAPFSKGIRDDEDTVWYGALRSRLDDSGYCSIKHSGDVLSGQEGGDLEDLERMSVSTLVRTSFVFHRILFIINQSINQSINHP